MPTLLEESSIAQLEQSKSLVGLRACKLSACGPEARQSLNGKSNDDNEVGEEVLVGLLRNRSLSHHKGNLHPHPQMWKDAVSHKKTAWD